MGHRRRHPADRTPRARKLRGGHLLVPRRGTRGHRVRRLDGCHIATGSDDRTVRLWSATTFEELAVVGVHRDEVTSVAWSRDGTRLLTASTDDTARFQLADPDYDRLEARARGRVFRTLDAEERWQHLLPPDLASGQ
ncbi:WD40 repeat domain-containing protein [Streptomyces sp. JNUCC 63]